MWSSRELSTREYRQMRKTVEDRIITLQRKTIVRPTVEVLAGLVGPDARACWDRLAAEGQGQRLNAVLRFLFAAVIIDEHRGRPVPSTTVALRSNPTPVMQPRARGALGPARPAEAANSNGGHCWHDRER
jgi:hypothetical protein